ncbi:hypothetical protein NEU17_004640 [Salmonella enterica]|nr:hypothetical protein [Salmonella enterica]EIL8000318.1 hypothetical protein [Salmonella enterica]EJI3392664.1 hypothetical protein [Salmonella enterica]
MIIKSNGKESDIHGREIIRIESGEMAIKAGTVDIRGNKYELAYQDGKWVLAQKDRS